jgi:hypothetical protein
VCASLLRSNCKDTITRATLTTLIGKTISDRNCFGPSDVLELKTISLVIAIVLGQATY